MRRLLILFVSIWITHCVSAQTLSVSSFKAMPMDMDALVNHPVTDHNGKKCAIIKVENSNTGFAFDTGTLQVQKVEQQPGEIWVYVQPGVRKMTIRHQNLGILREYPFPEAIKEGAVYVMKLESGNVHTYVEQAPTGAYLVMRLTPSNAVVWIDDEMQKMEEGGLMKFLTNGKHTYRVQAAGYEQEVGSVEITGERKELKVVLQSNMANLSLSCADANVKLFLDGKQVGTGSWHGEVVPGSHVLEAMRDGYRSQTKQIDVEERQTYECRFDELIAINGYLEVASHPLDTEVFLDGEKIGTTPFGPEKVLIGLHQLELRKSGYQTLKKDIVISEGETYMVNNALEKQEDKSVTSNKNVVYDSNKEFMVNGVSFTMVAVEGGTFFMGATPEQGKGHIDALPVHQVTLTSYMIGQTEVTQALWTAVMGFNPSIFKGNDLPVDNVNYNDCIEFIDKLNEKTGQNFRLPTEAEWEYAARGGNKSKGYKYSGSNDVEDVAWYMGNSSNTSHAVATKQSNELGIYDMSGNMIEWCSDWFDIYTTNSVNNPTGPQNGMFRILRGGCWSMSGDHVLVCKRMMLKPESLTCISTLRLALGL